MMTDDLKGTFVLVHPELSHDPAGKQNKIGIITQTDLPNEDVFVSFGNEPGRTPCWC
jgi:ethanolamine utilization protein EutP (predicted NTPase)